MSARAVRPVLVAAVLAAGVVVFFLLRPSGAEDPPQPQTTIEQALAGFVAERFGARYAGTCPQEFPEDGEIPRGMCSGRLSSTGEQVVYRVGHPFSEWVGEATFVRDASGWHVAGFERYPPLGG
jgi:hypothetical protein